MKDVLAAQATALGDDPRIAEILKQVCRITGMGFAAVARVTEERWICCQVEDQIEFGLDPGAELEIKTTICNDIRECGKAVVIDEVRSDPNWRTHHTPMLYGFESYASFPIFLADGSFFGTLCAIDPEPRTVSAPEIVKTLAAFASEVSAIISPKLLEGVDIQTVRPFAG